MVSDLGEGCIAVWVAFRQTMVFIIFPDYLYEFFS